MIPEKRILLCILDGWGIGAERAGNAIALAGTPHLDRLAEAFPHGQLQTSGLAVGLPEGQMGNSEVGHTNIGAGRVVYQDLVRINLACERRELAGIPPLREACDRAAASDGALHLLGLCSRGGVHSSLAHLFALVDLAKARGVRRLFVHAFTDGRDTPPNSGLDFLREVETALAQKQLGRVATVAGRFFAMDRDQRWDRIAQAYRAIVDGHGPLAASAAAAVLAAYGRGETDEFIAPTVVADAGAEPRGRLGAGDSAIFFNFRADRARELTAALALDPFQGFARPAPELATFVCLTEYDQTFGLPIAFGPDQPRQILPELLSQLGRRQFRCAETEKYAHVTFFFNGGREPPFPGEERALVPSPRGVKTYDLQPEMAAAEVADRVVAAVASEQFGFLLVNFANPDMVGHTGVLAAAMAAVRTVDGAVGRLAEACRQHRTALVVTADHGNCETMIDPRTGGPHTQHTLNPVPLILADPEVRGARLAPGILADVAPTLLQLYGLPPPPAMTGRALVQR